MIFTKDCNLTAAGRFHYREGGGITSHSHDYDFQIQLIYEGSAVETCAEKKFSVKSNDVVFVMQGTHHAFVVGKGNLRTLELKFTVGDKSTREKLSALPTCFQDINHTLQSLFSRIILETQQKGPSYKALCDALLIESLVLIERICKFGDVSSPSSNAVKPLDGIKKVSPLISAVNKYVFGHLDKNFSLEELSKGCGYNQDYIYRTIKKEFGLSALQYVNCIRFDQAKELIEYSDLSLSEIAWNLGFESLQYFSRFFKKYANIPPSEYMEKVRDSVRVEFWHTKKDKII